MLSGDVMLLSYAAECSCYVRNIHECCIELCTIYIDRHLEVLTEDNKFSEANIVFEIL